MVLCLYESFCFIYNFLCTEFYFIQLFLCLCLSFYIEPSYSTLDSIWSKRRYNIYFLGIVKFLIIYVEFSLIFIYLIDMYFISLIFIWLLLCYIFIMYGLYFEKNRVSNIIYSFHVTLKYIVLILLLLMISIILNDCLYHYTLLEFSSISNVYFNEETIIDEKLFGSTVNNKKGIISWVKQYFIDHINKITNNDVNLNIASMTAVEIQPTIDSILGTDVGNNMVFMKKILFPSCGVNKNIIAFLYLNYYVIHSFFFSNAIFLSFMISEGLITIINSYIIG